MVKPPLLLVFVCIANRNRSSFAEFFFSKLVNERDAHIADALRITSAGFITQRMRDKMVALEIPAPEPFFGRPLASTTRAFLLQKGIQVPEGWQTKGLNRDLAEQADMIVTVLPDQKQDLMKLYPVVAGRIFTIRELSQWDGYLLSEDYDFHEIPRDSSLWDYVEEDPEYVFQILVETEKMLVKAYPSIMEKLGLK